MGLIATVGQTENRNKVGYGCTVLVTDKPAPGCMASLRLVTEITARDDERHVGTAVLLQIVAAPQVREAQVASYVGYLAYVQGITD